MLTTMVVTLFVLKYGRNSKQLRKNNESDDHHNDSHYSHVNNDASNTKSNGIAVLILTAIRQTMTTKTVITIITATSMTKTTIMAILGPMIMMIKSFAHAYGHVSCGLSVALKRMPIMKAQQVQTPFAATIMAILGSMIMMIKSFAHAHGHVSCGLSVALKRMPIMKAQQVQTPFPAYHRGMHTTSSL